jgi:4-hydroxybenzoate polyprenyltransferase
MGFNRIADRAYDARNPRTAIRELPSGAISVASAIAAVTFASALFMLCAWLLNPLCFALSPVALAWVFGYSYTKRFTRLSHLVLGAGLGIAPVGGYLATTGSWSDPWWVLVALAAAVTTWVGGFDIFYALQDVGFDRNQGLHSIPAAVGEVRAIAVARVLHTLTVIALALVGVGIGGGALFWIGVALVAVLLVYEHSLVRADDLTRLDAAFFTLNGVISIVFFACVLAWRLTI